MPKARGNAIQNIHSKKQKHALTHTQYTHTQSAIPGFAFIPQQSKAESVGHSGNPIVPRTRHWPPQDEA